MSSVEVELNSEGVRELLRSDEMRAICESRARDALASLGDGYEVDSYVGKNRANAEIVAVSREARRENLESNTILRALR